MDESNAPIESLELSIRTFNLLKRTGVATVAEVLHMLERGVDGLIAVSSSKASTIASLEEILEKLKEHGYLSQEDSPAIW